MANLSAEAAKRQITIAALVRAAIVRKLYVRADPLLDMVEHLTFVAFGVNTLLASDSNDKLQTKDWLFQRISAALGKPEKGGAGGAVSLTRTALHRMQFA